jgi:hypothetical protein
MLKPYRLDMSVTQVKGDPTTAHENTGGCEVLLQSLRIDIPIT